MSSAWRYMALGPCAVLAQRVACHVIKKKKPWLGLEEK